MTKIEINSITGGELPISIFVCDVYLNQCTLVGVISSSVPPTVSFIVPPIFDSAPAIAILLRDSDGCERFEIAICGDSGVTKIFQDTDDDHIFQFMDFVIYQFEGEG